TGACDPARRRPRQCPQVETGAGAGAQGRRRTLCRISRHGAWAHRPRGEAARRFGPTARARRLCPGPRNQPAGAAPVTRSGRNRLPTGHHPRLGCPARHASLGPLPMGEPFYVTTAISYPNGKPHIGHAYEAIAADVIARFQRAQGRDVRFQTGTDEHGLKMAQAARGEGVDPKVFADKMSDIFQDMCDRLEIGYDRFIRTSEQDHHRASQAIWSAMAERGDLYLDRYEGWYSVRDEAYYDERELMAGEGGEKMSAQGTPVEWTVEESWFFRLSAYQQKLLDHYAANPGFIQPETRRNEVLRFAEGGLKDLSISRTSFDWGVKVPGSPEHVMYVWLDALTNYLTGLGYPDETELWERYWPADVHLIGKDVVRFHAVYWPAFLMSAGIPLPKLVYGHGFLLSRGEKMSKSVGNVVDPIALADSFGVDPLRYFLLREV